MKASLVDTDILSLFFRGHPQVVNKFDTYLQEYDTINLSIITYYEIVSGLKHRDTQKQLDLFLDFVSQNSVLPLTQAVVDISADQYADLRQRGLPIDDIDLLIAGTAMVNGLILVPHNQKHFDRIKDLEIEDWTETEGGV